MENLLNEPAVAYNRYYTAEEYLNMEWENGQRYEYWDGNLIAMAGASMNHAKIVSNLILGFGPHFREKGCRTFGPDTILKMKDSEKYFLPDVTISCNEGDLKAKNFMHNPSIIIEILSNTTELYDRTQKWDEYRKIKSLRHYLLVSQKEYRVEMFSRTSEHGLFFQQVFEGLNNKITLRDTGFEVTLAEVYEGISFPEEDEETVSMP